MSKGMPGRNVCDLEREVRTNIPEAVYAPTKDDKALIDAATKLLKSSGKVLLTKCTKRQTALLKKRFKSALRVSDGVAGTVVLSHKPIIKSTEHKAAVIAAGASDYPVAEEAAITLSFLGFDVLKFYDRGVAGIHRLSEPVEEINKNDVDVIVVVAGMEGALPSVVAGLVKQPIIAVPTSVGYGTGLGGVASVLTMLNSCSPGISVVNIDNGFGAAVCAAKMTLWLKRTSL